MARTRDPLSARNKRNARGRFREVVTQAARDVFAAELLESRVLLSVTPVGPNNSIPTPLDFAPAGDGRMLFDTTQGLWGTDGTAAGTAFLSPSKLDRPIAVGPVVFGNAIYYVSGHNLWLTDGTSAGTMILLDATGPQPHAFASISATGVSGGSLYFGASDDSGGSGLWRTDGAGEKGSAGEKSAIANESGMPQKSG